MGKLKLGDICSIKKGKKVEQTEQSNNSIRYIQIEDLRNNDYIKFCEKKENYVIANSSDIIIAWDGANAGTIGFGLNGAIGSTLAVLELNRDNLDTRFIGLLLRGKFNYLRSNCTGATIPHINRRSLEEIRIPLLPLEIQKQIAKNLDAVSELLSMRKQQLAELDNLIKSVFYDMFGDPVTNEKGWIKTKIEDTAAYEKNAIKAGPFGSALKKEYYVKKGYKIYGQEQVINNDASYGDYYISDEKYRELENCAIKEEDVLISLVGTYGKLLIIPKEFEKGIINPRLMKITFNKEKINTMFFKYCFESESMKNIISDKSRGGTMDILNAGIVRKLIIPLPPIEIQNQFATKVTKIEAQKSLVKKSIEETQLLFDSLMSQYFD